MSLEHLAVPESEKSAQRTKEQNYYQRDAEANQKELIANVGTI